MNSVRSALLLGAVALLPCAAHAQAIEAWVQRYGGALNGYSSASAIAVDAAGNAHVTGASSDADGTGQFTTIKYSSAGVLVWTNVYTAPGGRGGSGAAVALDAAGNVCVVGIASDGSGYAPCTTIKYSSTGEPLWTNVYTVSDSRGRAVAVDTNGDVVVMGTFGLSGGFTVKYSSAGARLWTKTHSWNPRALTLDASGSVVVTGDTGGSYATADYTTTKYSGTGVLLWTTRYNGPANSHDEARAVAVDGAGNVVVTGRSDGNAADYATIKYSSEGVPVWTNRYNGPGSDNDEARAVAVDATANVFVTGSSVGSGNTGEFATISYSSDGVSVWTNRYNGPENHGAGARALALDARGNVFVTGTSVDLSGLYHDYATVAHSSTGQVLWTQRYNGPGNDRDEPGTIGVDASGNVYVAGWSVGSGSGDYWARSAMTTIKYVTPPLITRQPLSCTNAVSTTASFSVEVAGSAPFTYQWRREGTNLVDIDNLSGARTPNLVIANVQPAGALGYSAVVNNAYGSVTSSVAQLTVVVPPSGGRLGNLGYSPPTGFSFIFRDGTVGQSYRIQRSLSLAEGSWSNWQSFTYAEPILFTDLGATGAGKRFYRAVNP